MPSQQSSNDADISEAVDQLASFELTDSQANEKSSDTSADGASEDEELWKPHAPTEECPVCFVPLSLLEHESIYFVCCGKLICYGCIAESRRALNVINAKRAKKKQPPLDNACPFCRTAPKFTISEYKDRIRKGDGQAAWNLAYKYLVGDARMNISKDEAKSSEILHHAADDLGSAVAMAKLGLMYFYGFDRESTNKTKGQKYLEEAAKLNNVPARSVLGNVEAQDENVDLAIRHWKLAATAGEELSVKMLWKFFFGGKLEKAELEETLRAHKEACDSMNSEERERRKLYEEAKERRE